MNNKHPDNPSQQLYFEFGAHFSYKEMCKRLKTLSEERQSMVGINLPLKTDNEKKFNQLVSLQHIRSSLKREPAKEPRYLITDPNEHDAKPARCPKRLELPTIKAAKGIRDYMMNNSGKKNSVLTNVGSKSTLDIFNYLENSVKINGRLLLQQRINNHPVSMYYVGGIN
jgi:hypothetical protein